METQGITLSHIASARFFDERNGSLQLWHVSTTLPFFRAEYFLKQFSVILHSPKLCTMRRLETLTTSHEPTPTPP